MSDNAHYRQAHTPHLSASQREALASKLHAQHDAIMQQLNALDQQTRTPDADDAAQLDGAHEVDVTLSEIEQFELNQINQALLRVVGQDYGVCVNCGAEIPLRRLEAEPQASRCLECQAQLERNASAPSPNLSQHSK
jgi:DnaK suppressor protein